jgi:phage/plasmid-associated DNA primase
MQVIKSWTGGDPVTARFLFAENFTFKPVGKIWLAANNKPAITERNIAAWRRVRLIPFNVTIPEAEQDKELESKLLGELPGILNWALDGLREYREHGLTAPKAIVDATNDYKKENASLEQFITECCDVAKFKTCRNSELYGAYLNFCGMSGFKALSQTKFSPELSSRSGISSTRTMHGITWIGIDLKKNWKACRVESNPTSQSGDAKHEGLEEIAQTSLISPSRETFTQKPTYPTYPTPNEAQDSDSVEEQPYINMKGCGSMSKADRPTPEKKIKDDPGLSRFKAGIRKYKHVCRSCGQHFEEPLVINGYGGYICEPCRRDGPPIPPPQANPQTTLEASI